MVFDGNNGQVS